MGKFRCVSDLGKFSFLGASQQFRLHCRRETTAGNNDHICVAKNFAHVTPDPAQRGMLKRPVKRNASLPCRCPFDPNALFSRTWRRSALHDKYDLNPSLGKCHRSRQHQHNSEAKQARYVSTANITGYDANYPSPDALKKLSVSLDHA